MIVDLIKLTAFFVAILVLDFAVFALFVSFITRPEPRLRGVLPGRYRRLRRDTRPDRRL
jgi:hypothetical protein